MVELVTAQGFKFKSYASVNIGGTYYDLDEMTPEQKQVIMGAVNVQGLNAAFAGQAKFTTAGGRPLTEVIHELERTAAAKEAVG